MFHIWGEIKSEIAIPSDKIDVNAFKLKFYISSYDGNEETFNEWYLLLKFLKILNPNDEKIVDFHRLAYGSETITKGYYSNWIYYFYSYEFIIFKGIELEIEVYADEDNDYVVYISTWDKISYLKCEELVSEITNICKQIEQ